MFSGCLELWELPLVLLSSGVSRALIIHFHTLGSFRSSCPRPSALCCSVVSVWFQLGAFPQDPQRVLGARSFFMRSECSDSPFLCVGFVGIVLFMYLWKLWKLSPLPFVLFQFIACICLFIGICLAKSRFLSLLSRCPQGSGSCSAELSFHFCPVFALFRIVLFLLVFG